MAIEQNHELCSNASIWIICDIRRYTDIDFFRNHFPDRLLLVRIETSIETRKKRDWVFTSSIDDSESECQLDKNVQWSFIFSNNDTDNFDEQMTNLINMINA